MHSVLLRLGFIAVPLDINTDAAGPGFHHRVIQPHFDPILPQLHVEYDSAYGNRFRLEKE